MAGATELKFSGNTPLGGGSRRLRRELGDSFGSRDNITYVLKYIKFLKIFSKVIFNARFGFLDIKLLLESGFSFFVSLFNKEEQSPAV